MHLEFSDGSVFHRDSDLNPNREKDGRFGPKGIKDAPDPHQAAKTRLSNVRSELKRMEAAGKATPEMLERKRKSLAEAEGHLKNLSEGKSLGGSSERAPDTKIPEAPRQMEKLHPEFKEALKKQGMELQAMREKLRDRLAKENEEVKELTRTHGEDHPRTLEARAKADRTVKEANEVLDRIQEIRKQGVSVPKGKPQPVAPKETPKVSEEPPKPIVSPSSIQAQKKTSTEPKGPQKRASAGEIKQLSGRPKYEAALPAVDELSANFRKEFSAVQAESRSLGYRIKAPQLSMRDGQPILKFEVDTPRDIRHPDENPFLTYSDGEYHTPKAAAYRQSLNRVEDMLNSFYNQLEDFSTKTGIAKDF